MKMETAVHLNVSKPACHNIIPLAKKDKTMHFDYVSSLSHDSFCFST